MLFLAIRRIQWSSSEFFYKLFQVTWALVVNERNPIYIYSYWEQRLKITTFLFQFQIKFIWSNLRGFSLSHTDRRAIRIRFVRIHLESSTHDEEGRRKARPLIRIINEAARRGWSFGDHYPRSAVPFVVGIFISTRLDLAGIHPWSSKYHFKRIPRPVSAAADK